MPIPAHRRAAAVRTPLLAGLTVTLLVGAGCARSKTGATPDAATAATASARPAPPAIDYAVIRPNELGHIPVIMYHEIGGKPGKRAGALTRSADAFRKDLELMYAAGFRPVNLSDVLDNAIDLPAGKSPIVLTFDDARKSQFHLIETDKAYKIDPDCAVGILDAFHKRHPDWPMRATFFVLPKSRLTLEPFGQPGLGPQKMSYLLEQGMEIGNHSIYHKDMSRMTPAQLQAEIGGAHKAILEAVPNAKIQAIALPMGKYPRNKSHWKYLTHGTFEGVTYRYKAAMKAQFRAIPAPANKAYDPLRLERIDSIDGRWGVRWWIQELSRGSSAFPRYVSDGDPKFVSIPKGTERLVNVAALGAQKQILNAYSPFGESGGAKPIVGAAGGAGVKETTAPAASGSVTPAVASKPITGG